MSFINRVELRFPYLCISKIQGFTLIEILVAIFIFGIVITTLFTSYSSVIFKNEAIENNILLSEMANNCLNRMMIDFNSIYISLPPVYKPPDFNDPPDPYRFVGDTINVGDTEFSRLKFTSRAHVSFGKQMQDEIAEVVYYVQKGNDGKYILRRSDSTYPFEPFKENKNDPVLCEKIKSLVFFYYDNDNQEHEFWDSDSNEYEYSIPKYLVIKIELEENSNIFSFETSVAFHVHRDDFQDKYKNDISK